MIDTQSNASSKNEIAYSAKKQENGTQHEPKQ